MSYTTRDYWVECVECAFDEAGITATKEQINTVAGAFEGARENIGMAFHQPENPMRVEVDSLKRELRKEKEKVTCRDCDGTGRLIYTAGPWGVNAHCDRCNGDGRLTP